MYIIYMFGCMYSHRECYNSDHNQKVLDDLIQEVKTLNDTFEVAQIKGIIVFTRMHLLATYMI